MVLDECRRIASSKYDKMCRFVNRSCGEVVDWLTMLSWRLAAPSIMSVICRSKAASLRAQMMMLSAKVALLIHLFFQPSKSCSNIRASTAPVSPLSSALILAIGQRLPTVLSQPFLMLEPRLLNGPSAP